MAWSILGAVLAGGRSRRMGRDKAALVVGEDSLAARAVAALRASLDEVVIVTRRPRPDLAELAPVITDLLPGQGPLAGVHAALCHARGRSVFVLACDLPNVGPEVVAHLARQAAPSGRARVWYAASGDQRQPLCGVWSAGCRAPIEAALSAGRRCVQGLIERLDAVPVPLGPELPFFRPDLLRNLNRPRDLEASAPA